MFALYSTYNLLSLFGYINILLSCKLFNPIFKYISWEIYPKNIENIANIIKGKLIKILLSLML